MYTYSVAIHGTIESSKRYQTQNTVSLHLSFNSLVRTVSCSNDTPRHQIPIRQEQELRQRRRRHPHQPNLFRERLDVITQKRYQTNGCGIDRPSMPFVPPVTGCARTADVPHALSVLERAHNFIVQLRSERAVHLLCRRQDERRLEF